MARGQRYISHSIDSQRTLNNDQFTPSGSCASTFRMNLTLFKDTY